MSTLLNLLNRLAIMVQPKRQMREEFGEIVDQALEAKYITEDFYNFGISDTGLKRRDALRAGARASITKPVAPSPSSVPAPPPARTEVTPAPVLEQSKPVVAASTPRATMNKFGEMREKIFNLIDQCINGITSNELSAEAGIKTGAANPHLIKLLDGNKIVRSSKRKGGQPYRYYSSRNAPAFESQTMPHMAAKLEAGTKLASKRISPAPQKNLETRESEPASSVPFNVDLKLELNAIELVFGALKPLDGHARERVYLYVKGLLDGAS